jgi:hypothetical protein
MWRSPSRPPAPRPVLRFALLAAALTLPLVFLPGSQSLYPRLFAAHAGPLLDALTGKRQLRIAAADPALRADRADLHVASFDARGLVRHWRIEVRLWSRGWWPTAAASALILATPLAWGRRLGALAAGVALLDLLLLLRLGLLVWALDGATGPGGAGVRSLALQVIIESFNSWVAPLVSVLLVWAVVARPGAHVDLSGMRRWLPGQGAARRVGQEGQQERREGAEDHEAGAGGDRSGRGEP